MPKYKLGDDTYTLPEHEVQGFLAEFPDATLIEEEEGKTNGVAETGATVTPETGQAPENMGSDSVNTSLELVDYDSLATSQTENPLEKFLARDENGTLAMTEYAESLTPFERARQTTAALSVDKDYMVSSDGDIGKAEMYNQQIQDIGANLPASSVTAQEASDTYGFVEPREAKVSKPGYQVPGQMAPTVSYVPMFDSDQEYDNYLKKTLGDKYESYVNYLETGDVDISDKESRLNARKQVVQRQAELFTIANDISEDVQKYMMFEPQFATGNSKEEQEFAVNELRKSYDTNLANYKIDIKEWESKAVPLSEKINEIQSQLQGFTYDDNDQPILSSEDQVNQYNSLVEQNNDNIQQWEKQGFGVLYNTLVKQEEVLQIELDNYNSMLDDSRQALVDAEAYNNAIAKDYTFTARVGEAWDSFFVQSTRNFLDLGQQVAFKGLDWLTGGKYSVAFDSLIDVVSENNKNYNLEMSKKAENIPAAPTLDEIDQQGVDYWDWFSISFQDNSPVIATTFIPAGASLKGASLVKSAVGAAAKKTALQQQKQLLLAGKRTAQSVFFTAETGGKFGELQLENEDYSLFQKAFTSFAFGTLATYAETLGTIRLVSGGRNIAKSIGAKAARKEFYTRPSRFGFNVAGATLKGLKTLPKGLAVEQIEEVATQLGHNYFDILVLNKDKSLIDGLNKDFFANVAVTSFGIMSPTTGGNIINGVKNEFRTRSEILNNQKLTQELIGLTEAPATADSRVRKQEILEELALSDAISLHKLRYMSASDIERVADLNRQTRQLQGQMNMLGKTGERSETAKRRKAEIKTEYDKLVTAQQEILNSKERNLKQREKNLNESLGVAAQNSEAAYWLGVNDFYNEIAMTQMGGGDYVSIEGELQEDGTINYTNLDEQISKHKGKTIAVDGKKVDAFDHIKSQIESGSFYGVRVGKDIIINQPLINARIGVAPTSKEAQWAAVTPLEELFHISVAGKKVKFDGDAKAAIDEVQSVLDEKLELKQISEETYKDFTDRLKLYTDKSGVDVEEFIAQLNNMAALGDINLSNIDEAPSLKTFLNNTIRSTFGDMSWTLNLKTSGDVFNLIKNFRSDVDKQVMQATPEDEEVKESRALSPRGQEFIALAKENVLTNESLVETINSPSSTSKDKFGAIEAIVENNFPVISKAIQFNPTGSIPMDAVKEAITEQIQGIFPGRNTALFDTYNPETSKVTTFIDTRLGPRQAEILERAQAIGGTTQGVDITEARGIAVEETTPVSTKGKALAKKPTETVVYSDEVLSNVGAANTEALETRITEEIQTAFKGKDISRFKELKDIPNNLAKLYADMFGIKTVAGISDFKRNFQNFDEVGIRNMRTFLNRNAEDDFRRLPKTKDDKKKATGIKQTKLGKVLYDANDNLIGTLKQYKDILKGVNVTLPTYDGKMEEFNRIGKDGKPLPLYRDSQHYKAALKFHIQNRIAEDVMPDKAQRLSAGLKFSKAGDIINVSDTFNLDYNAKDKLLETFIGEKSFNLKTEKGIKEFVEAVKTNLLPLMPKDFWFGPRKGDIFTPSYKVVGSSENVELKQKYKDLYNNIYLPSIRALRDDDSIKYGKPIDGVDNYSVSAYSNIFKNKDTINKNIKNGKVEEWNKKVSTIHREMWKRFNQAMVVDGKINKTTTKAIANYLGLVANDTGHWHKLGAQFIGYSDQITGKRIEYEHAMPATMAYLYLLDASLSKADFDTAYDLIIDNYKLIALDKAMDDKLRNARTKSGYSLQKRMPDDWSVVDGKWWQRYFNSIVALQENGIDPNSIVDLDGKTFQEVFNIDASGANITPAIIDEQNKIIKSSIKASKANASKLPGGLDLNNPTSWDRFNMLDVVTRQKFPRTQYDLYPYEALTIDEKIEVVKAIPGLQTTIGLKFSKTSSAQDVLGVMRGVDDAIDKARNADAPVKGISVWDFDDTLATTKSNVLYEMPDGTTGVLNAEQFAKQGEDFLEQGAVFDFSEFEKVTKGAKGPMFEKAVARNRKFGNDNVFILTARTQAAAEPIHQFLKAIGLDIPLKNIVGLGDSTPAAKASWIVGKATEGYNDFYFADDAYKNVKAVQDALSVLDVKSKVRQAYVKFSKASALDKGFNDILEQTTSIASEKEYKKVKAEVAGASLGRVFRGIPYSAQDFVGLLYETLGKGKLGDAQMAWYKEHLIKPYARAVNDIDNARLSVMQDYRALKKQLGFVPKNLRKKIPGEPFTREQAVRVYIWNKLGYDVPGISKQDLKELSEYVSDNTDLQVFANQVIAIQKGEYAKPKEGWPAGTITTDIQESINTGVRAKYLTQWQNNVDVIFSEKNMNKLEAAYGKKWRKSMENMLDRMKTGRNRRFSDDSLTGRFTDWLQGSIGAIMFFNSRSALLQNLSSINFLNFTDNNPLAAAKAFANQKQYWSDFMTLINSDFLKARRSGLRMNVNEADIADMAKKGGPRAVISKLLQFGFTPTQVADSFAIASGGATFYRNRIKSLMKQGMSQAEAETQAFEDFRETAEESQQSSRPDRISMQQAGPLGRLILAFQNTPSQYARIIDKSVRDLKNGRGDRKTNISKIIYYSTVQNLLFNALQQALFAFAFDDEEPEDQEKKDKYISIANGMADSLLRGTGVAGGVMSVTKNAIIRIIEESQKKNPNYEKVGADLQRIAPPISSKLSKINQAARSFKWDKDEMINGGWGLDNPAYLAVGNVVSATTNIPMDRAVKKINNLTKASDSELETWERLALLGGWQDWELGIEDEKKTKPKTKTKKKSKTKTTRTKKM